MSKPEIIILNETLGKSIAKNAASFCTIVAIIGVGVVLDSAAMQWLGALIWMLWLLAKASMRGNTLTIEEARRRLDEIERERGR